MLYRSQMYCMFDLKMNALVARVETDQTTVTLAHARRGLTGLANFSANGIPQN